MRKGSPITQKDLKTYNDAYSNDPYMGVLTNAYSKANIPDLAYCQKNANKMKHDFSVVIPTMEVTNQKSSGRCWLFAALNILREKIGKESNLEQFELSQSYCAFWDKFERANYFLESIVETADLDPDDRTVTTILQNGVNDGGQWDMFVNIVAKYGVVPQSAMTETNQSSNTGSIGSLLNTHLKECAVKLRKLCGENKPKDEIAETKSAMLGKIYNFLCMCYGSPPESFDFEYTDKDKAYHCDRDCTPKGFFEKYFKDSLMDYVSVINAPTKDKPFDRTFTVKYLGNVVEGNDILYLNLEMGEMKNLVIKQLKDNELVWFGCDTGKYGTSNGIWDDNSLEYENLTNLTYNLTKAERLDYRESAMGHAMVLTGVNLDENGAPDRWKIENSWGDDKGKKGYYICSDSWFDNFVYQAVINKKYLEDKKEILSGKPIELNAWDPMGSLA
jgi:bleomycin hydrolase